jgi:hypothetical protein
MFSLAQAHRRSPKTAPRRQTLQQRLESTIGCFMDLVEGKALPDAQKGVVELASAPMRGSIAGDGARGWSPPSPTSPSCG